MDKSRKAWLRPEMVTPVNADAFSDAFPSATGDGVFCFRSDEADEEDGAEGAAFRLNANFGFGAAAALSFSSNASSSFKRYRGL